MVIPSLFRHAISSQRDHATIFLRCCHILQEKAKAIDLPFWTKEIGKNITSKLFWQGLGWQEKGIFANVVKDPQKLNPAALAANFVALKRVAKKIHSKAHLSCISLANQRLMDVTWLACKFDLDQRQHTSLQINGSSPKLWPNGFASRPKFSACVQSVWHGQFLKLPIVKSVFYDNCRNSLAPIG